MVKYFPAKLAISLKKQYFYLCKKYKVLTKQTSGNLLQYFSRIRLGDFALALLLAFMLSSCGIYSFTGASIPAGAKTISVQYFPNNASLVEPTLSPAFTDALRDKFTSQTNLRMVNKNGDLALEGEIVDYKTTPVAIQADQTSALNRLTVVVNVRFTNKLDPSKDFETRFTQFVDYPSTENLNGIKDELIKQIVEDLTDNIFNKAVVNW